MIFDRLNSNRRRGIVGPVVAFSVLLSQVERTEAVLFALLEGPEEEQTVAGVAVIRGWAFSDTAGVHVTKIDLRIDSNVITIQPAVIPLLNQLNERMADLRTRAQEATTSASRAELLRLLSA